MEEKSRTATYEFLFENARLTFLSSGFYTLSVSNLDHIFSLGVLTLMNAHMFWVSNSEGIETLKSVSWHFKMEVGNGILYV